MEILHFSQRLSGDFNARHVQDREAARESAPQHAHRTWPAVQAAASVPLRAGILYTCCGQVAPRLLLLGLHAHQALLLIPEVFTILSLRNSTTNRIHRICQNLNVIEILQK